MASKHICRAKFVKLYLGTNWIIPQEIFHHRVPASILFHYKAQNSVIMTQKQTEKATERLQTIHFNEIEPFLSNYF